MVGGGGEGTVVVDVLAGDGGSGVDALGGLMGGGARLKLGEMGCLLGFGVFGVLMADLAVLCWDEVVGVFLRKAFLVGDRLDSGVVVILVHFTVDGLCGLLVAVRLYLLFGDGRANCFVDIGAVALVGSEITDGFFGGLHLGYVVNVSLDEIMVDSREYCC